MDTFDWIFTAAKIGFIVVVLLQVVPIMVWVERRGSALLQNRLGPNRVGPFGLLQSLADAVKFIFKEDVAPGHVEPFYYTLAPFIAVAVAFSTFAVIPFAGPMSISDRMLQFQIADLNVGLLYVFSISSLGVYAIIISGWASNNKYALLGSLRSSAQMISYELSLGLSVIGIVMAFSSVSLADITQAQGQVLFQMGALSLPKWGVFIQPIGFIVFLVAIFAETNRTPFDLPEGESEIVAGYHLEYGSMKFAMFMLAEYLNMTTGSAMIASLFFGGWQLLPGLAFLLDHSGLAGFYYEVARVGLQAASFGTKVAFFLWFFVWVRWTLPRFRYDQLMDLGWKILLPLSLANIFFTGILIYLGAI